MSVCSCTIVVYVVGLDIAALGRSGALTKEKIFNWYPVNNDIMTQQWAIPLVMLIQDVLICVCTFTFTLLMLCECTKYKEFVIKWCESKCSKLKLKEKKCDSAFVLLGPISCIVVHSFHILVGFIHTPYHATSVLVLYAVAFFVYNYICN